MVASTPLGRLGQPEDISPVAVFLASDDSGWITGRRFAPPAVSAKLERLLVKGLAPLARGLSKSKPEGAAEGSFGFVSDLARDLRDRDRAEAQQLRSLVEPPRGEVGGGGFTDETMKPVCKRGAGRGRQLRHLLYGPRMLRRGMDGGESLADTLIHRSEKPAWLRIDTFRPRRRTWIKRRSRRREIITLDPRLGARASSIA